MFSRSGHYKAIAILHGASVGPTFTLTKSIYYEQSIDFDKGFEKVTILVSFLHVSLRILIRVKSKFFTITSFYFFTFLLI